MRGASESPAVTKVPGIGPTRGAALLRLGVSIWTSSDGFRIFSKILRSFLTKFSSGATMISSALSRLRRPQGTQGTRSMAPKTCDFCRQEGSLDVPGITSKLQQNIVQCPPSCSWVHMVWAFNDFKRDQVMLSWVWSLKKLLYFLPALPEHGKLHCKEKH